VHQGFSRTRNSALIVSALPGRNTSNPRVIDSSAMLMAIAQAMSRETRVLEYCKAFEKDIPDRDKVLLSYRTAVVTDLIREVSIFLDGKMEVNEDIELSFPSMGTFLDNVEVVALMRKTRASVNEDFKLRVQNEFNALSASFAAVAHSKDLRPRFAMFGKNKKTKASTHDALTIIDDRLRKQWKSILDDSVVESNRKVIKESVRRFLMVDAGKNANVRADKRWIQGLNHVHSLKNTQSFGPETVRISRLVELDCTEDEQSKIPGVSVRMFGADCKASWLRHQEEKGNSMSAVFAHIHQKRKLFVDLS